MSTTKKTDGTHGANDNKNHSDGRSSQHNEHSPKMEAKSDNTRSEKDMDKESRSGSKSHDSESRDSDSRSSDSKNRTNKS